MIYHASLSVYHQNCLIAVLFKQQCSNILHGVHTCLLYTKYLLNRSEDHVKKFSEDRVKNQLRLEDRAKKQLRSEDHAKKKMRSEGHLKKQHAVNKLKESNTRKQNKRHPREAVNTATKGNRGIQIITF